MKAVSYLRVSTAKQADFGAGLELQRAAIEAFCGARGWEIVAEFQDVAGGKSCDRPGLHAALHRSRVSGATLVVASLDRLSRDVVFVTELLASPADFVAADFPDAGKMVLQIMAVVAEHTRESISASTREGLKRAKERGQKLGNPNGAAALRRANMGNVAAVASRKAKARAFYADLEPVLNDIWASGYRTLRDIADQLNRRQIKTRRGGKWHPSTVTSLLDRTGREKLRAACRLDAA